GLLPPVDSRMPGTTPEKLQEALRYGRDQGGAEKFVFASFLFSHNFQVGLLSMALGVLAAVPTIFLIGYNGMILGAFAALHHKSGIALEMWAWILPHGITELLAIVFCGGIGLMLGTSVVCPGNRTRMDSLSRAGIESGWIALGCGGMLVFAAVVESYLRQSHLSMVPRLVFAAATAIFWIFYIAYGFFEKPENLDESDSSVPLTVSRT
ncbi:MAG: stage II sporulation protein M, partial [Planctomycetaceae bacterium]|nr:stage II sporulation protein M [Planctomycetaceae bacterium]